MTATYEPKSYEQMIEDIKKNAIGTIGQAIAGKKIKDENGNVVIDGNGKEVRGKSFAPFLKHQEPQNMPRAYNASTGVCFSGINSLFLDIKKTEMNYKDNQWITLTQAKMLKADEKEIAQAKANWKDNSVRVHYIQKKEKIPTYTNKPLLDKDGNPKFFKDGNPVFEFARDKNGRILYETKDIEPILREERVYNIANFPSINKEKLKTLNAEAEQKHIYRHFKDNNKSKGVILEDIAKNLTTITREQIENYFKAQNFKIAYDVPKSLNEIQKQEVAKIVDTINKNSHKKQETIKENKEKEVQKEETKKENKEKTQKPKGRTR